MQFRLGRFRVEPDGSTVLDVLREQLAERAASFARTRSFDSVGVKDAISAAREEAQRRDDERAQAPCLLESLAPDSPERGWLGELLEVLESSSSAAGKLTLEACEAQPGPRRPIVLALSARGVAGEIRPGDVVCAGAAVHAREDGGLELRPRVYRLACANGAMLVGGTIAARELQPGDVRQTLAGLLGRPVFERIVAPLQAAAAQPVTEEWIRAQLMRLIWTQAMDARRQRDRADRTVRVLDEFDRGGDRTAWGLINAITSAAKDRPDWVSRLDEERGAAGILAALERPLPQRPVGLALQPPASSEHLAAHA